ncbi:hypothetical protein CP533_0702 [Ophiocordyceps camponoti-saundersi (nom. inval.)]|nr:hypothetical protein CP533_0702 [Ophiocordyceps camponoti-saundersi (nom. inval.)]
MLFPALMALVATAACLPSSNKTHSNSSEAAYQYLNPKTQPFLVNGSAIPEVAFDVGESYAGLLPVSNSTDSDLFFWFFPSKDPKASNEVCSNLLCPERYSISLLINRKITIWLNGGPGDSGMLGMLQGNGPFLWQPGSPKPVRNPHSWNLLTNIVYMDQPVGTGFSSGTRDFNDVEDIARQFLMWFENFVNTFDLHGRKVYIVGESYAGHMIPYIAARMLDRGDTTYFNVKGIQIINGLVNEYAVLQAAPAANALDHFREELGLNHTLVSELKAKADGCGYTQFMADALTYPPPVNFPATPDDSRTDCRIWQKSIGAIFGANSCFNVYHLTDKCPYLPDVMEEGPSNYFNRPEVQKLLHVVPPREYRSRGGFQWTGNPGKNYLGPMPSAWGPLPRVIERTNNTIISHGVLDYLFLVNGTLATIQNMTWNGARGFHKAPTDRFLVPQLGLVASDEGSAHSERGLTFTSVTRGGHAMTQYAPRAAYRQLEFLLGRIQSLY